MSEFDAALIASPVIAVVRADRVRDPAGLVATLAQYDINLVEFTLTTRDALDAIRRSCDVSLVGAGSVFTAQEAAAAIEAGARFIVSPCLALEVIELCSRHGVPVIPGILTPSELHEALNCDVAAVKVFPASVGGPKYIKELLGPYPAAALVPSGGISAAGAKEYLDHGARAVCVGNALVPARAVENGDNETIAAKAQLVAQLALGVAEPGG